MQNFSQNQPNISAAKDCQDKGDKSLYYCNYSKPPHGKRPYLAFVGGSPEIRKTCGKVLIGPFLLKSNFACYPQISIKPFCLCGKDFYATFVDPCGNQICPVVGQKFYISLCTAQKFLCFEIKAFAKLFNANTLSAYKGSGCEDADYAEDYEQKSCDEDLENDREWEDKTYFAEDSKGAASLIRGITAKMCVCVNLEECQPVNPPKKQKTTVYQPKTQCAAPSYSPCCFW